MKQKQYEAPRNAMRKLSKMSKSSQCLGGFIKASDFFKNESGEKLD
jgi:hypothetical protein